MTAVYTIVAKADLSELYDEIGINLCGGKSGFGRNKDALFDVLTGGFGKLYYDKQNKTTTKLIVKQSNLLTPEIRKIFEEAIIESANYYDPHFLYSYKWLSIIFA